MEDSVDFLDLKFSEPHRLDTRRGRRMLRTAAPTEQFWAAWRADKDALKAAGFGVGKFGGAWQVQLWSGPNDERPDIVAKREAEEVAASCAVDADIDVPAPEGLEYRPFQRAGIAYALRVFGDV